MPPGSAMYQQRDRGTTPNRPQRRPSEPQGFPHGGATERDQAAAGTGGPPVPAPPAAEPQGFPHGGATDQDQPAPGSGGPLVPALPVDGPNARGLLVSCGQARCWPIIGMC